MSSVNNEKKIDKLAGRILDLEHESRRRFMEVNAQQTLDLIETQKNVNTKQATASHVRLFSE